MQKVWIKFAELEKTAYLCSRIRQPMSGAKLIWIGI